MAAIGTGKHSKYIDDRYEIIFEDGFVLFCFLFFIFEDGFVLFYFLVFIFEDPIAMSNLILLI